MDAIFDMIGQHPFIYITGIAFIAWMGYSFVKDQSKSDKGGGGSSGGSSSGDSSGGSAE